LHTCRGNTSPVKLKSSEHCSRRLSADSAFVRLAVVKWTRLQKKIDYSRLPETHVCDLEDIASHRITISFVLQIGKLRIFGDNPGQPGGVEIIAVDGGGVVAGVSEATDLAGGLIIRFYTSELVHACCQHVSFYCLST